MDEKEEYVHKEQHAWIKVNREFVETSNTKLFWTAIDGVFICDQDRDEYPDDHTHIVFVGGQRLLLVFSYAPELWRLIQEFQPEWITGPSVAQGFSCSSIWRKADSISHTFTDISVLVRDVSTQRLIPVYEKDIECCHCCGLCEE